MNTLFYRNRRLLVLVLALICVSGFAALKVLPRAEDPTLTGRVARVVVRLPGADPARVDALVAEPLERELLKISELRRVITTSKAGVCGIVLQLADEVTDPERVWASVRARLDEAAPRLPPGADEPVLEDESISAFTLIVAIRHEGEGAADLPTMGRLARTLRDRLRAVKGTADVDIWGAVPDEIQVDVPAHTLSSLGRSALDVAREVRASDAKVSAGTLRGEHADMLVEVTGELDSLARVRDVPVRQAPDGRVLRLGDVADVRRGAADPAPELTLIGGKPAVVVAARMSPGQRVDLWAARAKAVVALEREQLPRGLSLPVVFDQVRYTDARLVELASNLLIGVVLVVLVLIVLMGWRSALLVGLALPLATLMVLSGMRLLSIPLHQMSVTGLIIALGLLIDNAIVMTDEVELRLRQGLAPVDAVGGAVRHLRVPLLGSTLTTVLAFSPMFLMPGPAGEFVGAIGLSVSLALVSSLFLALTVVPTLRALVHGGGGPDSPAEAPSTQHDSGNPVAGAGAQGEAREAGAAPFWRSGLRLPGLTVRYRSFLQALFARPALGALLTATPALVGFVAILGLPEQFFPPSDRDQLQVHLRLAHSSSLERTRSVVARARDLLREHEAVDEVHWFLGRSAPKFYYNQLDGEDGSAFYSEGLVQLKHSGDGAATAQALQARLDEDLPEAHAVVKLLEQGPPFKAPVEFNLFGPDPVVLRELGERARGVLQRVPDVVLARTTQVLGRPQLKVQLEEEHARFVGITPTELAGQLDAALRGAPAGSVLEGNEEVGLRVRVSSGSRRTIGGLESLGVFGSVVPGSDARRAAPVAALASLSMESAPGALTRQNGERINSVQGFVSAGVLPSKVLSDYLAALKREKFSVPPGYRVEIGGESSERDEAVGNLMSSAGLLMILMVATLVLSFQSFRQAAVIGVVGFLSIGLALGALWIFGATFGFMAIIGTMGLIGVAINDAIVVLAAIREDPAAVAGDRGAVLEVVLRSTRHVVATTLTTIAGFLPLLLSGGSFWRPLSITIAGGVAGATILALTFVPCAFLVVSCRGAKERGCS